MRPVFLNLDNALDAQHALRGRGGLTVEARDLGPALRLWSRAPALAALSARLRDQAASAAGPDLVFAGSGDFHHVTPLLIERAVAACGARAVTVVHFDNHPDWVRFENGLHCGSWVGHAARTPGVAKVITVGVCSSDIDRPETKRADLSLVSEGRVELYPYRALDGGPILRVGDRNWPSMTAMGQEGFINLLASRIETDAVYITIDKDVLRPDDAITNWDQGQLSLAALERLVRAVAERARVIGADVVGDWSQPRYGPDLLSNLLKRGEAFLDQPRGGVPGDQSRTNEATNLRLLSLFAEVTS
ncbi:arginase family protein [Caulobacter sp. BK020]|uniref:arginase family protein n=1 Tax=Caulobacter sp. BK020 TaxID=2512117 RepID=UPI001052C590|nr:arginase family protein [Caulobacter sp. BK020]TCS04314.1 arginase family enzyme [Caulobacter sp. BK020]